MGAGAEQGGQGGGGRKKDDDGLSSTDAVLNCPCCFTMLSGLCQRHEAYASQYRAVYVRNCSVKMNEMLFYPRTDMQRKGRTAGKRRKERREHEKVIDTRKGDKPEQPWEHYDIYFPVYCAHCGEEVGVFDHDEVYHFHNVFASY